MSPKSSDIRRQEISQALLRTIARHGYAKSTINKIAAEADLTPGLIHYHFKTKQDILRGLIQTLTRAQKVGLETIARSDAPPQKKLYQLIHAMLAVGTSAKPEVAAAWVVIAAEAIRQPEIAEDFQDALQTLSALVQEVIDEGVESGAFSIPETLTPQAATAALVASVQGYLTLGVTVQDVIPAGTAAEATWRMACGLLELS